MNIEKYLERDEKGRYILAFGKYEGEFLEDVAYIDEQYVWYMAQQTLPDEVRTILANTREKIKIRRRKYERSR